MQNGQLMLKSDKLEFERGAAAKAEGDERNNGKGIVTMTRDGTIGSCKSPASLRCPVESLSNDSAYLHAADSEKHPG